MTNSIDIIRAEQRGHANHGWLESYHTFSFANYHNPEMIHHGPLRVINDDRVAPGRGFPMHSHSDAEIFSYVLSGTIAHKDTLGNGSEVSAGGVQFMSAGSGVSHSEFNPSDTEPVHFLQIWLLPDMRDAAPRYETLQITEADKAGALKLFLSKSGREGSIRVNQDADSYAATLNGDQAIRHIIAPERVGYLHVAKGKLSVNGQVLSAGDGAKLTGEVALSGGQGAEVLLFDMAPLPH